MGNISSMHDISSLKSTHERGFHDVLLSRSMVLYKSINFEWFLCSDVKELEIKKKWIDLIQILKKWTNI